MEYYKPTPSPFQYEVKLTATDTTPKVDVAFYHQLVNNPLDLTHPYPNISFSFDIVALYMKTPNGSHYTVTKMVL